METSFYEDNAQFTVGNKRPATLDLNPKAPSGKKLRLNQAVQPLVIESPDLQSFKLTTPDIERIVLNGFPTPTPNLTFPAKVSVKLFLFVLRGSVKSQRENVSHKSLCSSGKF